ncbi:MAG: CpsD/CapB family tyrosine-protein kinase [Clostridia bacterium]
MAQKKKPKSNIAKGNVRTRDNIQDTRNKIGEDIDFASSEAYKQLRTSVMFTLEHNNKCKIFGVTSSVAGEGKSVTSINLAMSFAQMGTKVLLIECDLRKPVFADYFDLNVRHGLVHAIIGLSKPEDVIYRHENYSRLEIVPAGVIPPNPSELLASSHMKKLIDIYAEDYQIIMLDLPPVTVVTDALVVSKFTQGMLLVVRDNYVEKTELAESIRQLNIAGAKILGFTYNFNNSLRGDYYYKKGYKKYGDYKKSYYK